MSQQLEKELWDALLEASKEARDMLHYYPSHFLDMLQEKGAVRTSEELMSRPRITSGLTKLYELKRLDLSIEAIVLEHSYKTLFQEETLNIARKSMRDLHYEYDEYFSETSGGDNWTDDELGAAIDTYFVMLANEAEGRAYKKTDLIGTLRATVLRTRTKSSVERRMQNISSVLEELCVEWIDGYKPLSHVGTGVNDKIRSILHERGYVDANLYETTFSNRELDEKVASLSKLPLLGKPRSNKNPVRSETSTTSYRRDPLVKAWVLKHANGFCENCDQAAPFHSTDGAAYMEVHHVVFLSQEGVDGVENAVAVCPNCHQSFHYSSDAEERKLRIYSKVKRLEKEK